ncbi:MAG TPA: hypothetical protein VGG33_04430, partial [Polyangia bacterium]
MRPASERTRGQPRGISLIGAAILSVASTSAWAQAQGGKSSRQEETRRKLLEQVGLQKSQTPPPAPPPAEPPPEPVPAPPPDAGAAAATPSPAAAAPPKPGFSGRVHQDLLGACRSCHAAGGMAAATRLLLGAGVARDYASVRGLADLGSPRRSVLLTKGTGVQHAGGPTIPTGGEVYRRVLAWIAAGALLNASAGEAAAAAATPAVTTPPEPRRRRTPVPVPAPAPPTAVAVPTPADTPPPAPATPDVPADAPSAAPARTTNPTAVAFHGELARACLACHRAGAPAGMTRYKLTGTAADDLAASRAFADADKSPSSPLVTKAAGEMHGGGPIWPKDSPGQQTLLAWLAAGAPDSESTLPSDVTTSETPAAPSADTPPPAAPAAPALPAGPPTAPPSAHAPKGLHLGHELTLNGRFDLNLERRGFSGNPWEDGAKTALQSHHHFLFLGRQSADDPFVFTVELTSLAFYEAALRLGPRRGDTGLHVRAGKLLVPFGTEPLFHQSYGGHVGFDQRVLPPIWAAEGAAVTGHHAVGAVTLRADLYSVRGHMLRR